MPLPVSGRPPTQSWYEDDTRNSVVLHEKIIDNMSNLFFTIKFNPNYDLASLQNFNGTINIPKHLPFSFSWLL